MWGNRLGWVLSACLALVAAQRLWTVSRPPRPSVPSGAFSNLLSPVALPADPRTVTQSVMVESRDAGELYRQAIEQYAADRKTYDAYSRDPRSARATKPPAVEPRALTCAAQVSEGTSRQRGTSLAPGAATPGPRRETNQCC